ncbi:MAG: T9SS type A sorting domain-containing protein, partial [Bacteroidota bacterium]|nr:T9SS type A sorting domain-containing protein [Bacteroidota bacterium]
GVPMATGTITNLLSTSLPKDNLLGTPYNWIGRSCYAENGDLYLRKTLVYDFRLYRKALSAEEIMTTDLNVGNTISLLDAAYIANHTSAVNQVKASQYQVIASVGSIEITGLVGGEKVSVFDVTGRQFQVTNPSEITVTPGMYIVKVNGFVTKVVVK